MDTEAMTAKMIENLKLNTGKSLEQWITIIKAEKDLSEEEYKYLPKKDELVEDKFTLNFSSNGGKFLYATDSSECEDYFNKIIEENDWAEKSILCFNDSFTNWIIRIHTFKGRSLILP